MRWGVLWTLLPDEVLYAALPLIVVGLGLALMLGVIPVQTALGIFALVLLLPLMAPIVEALFGQLPVWVSLLFLAFFMLSIMRGLAALVLGSRAADTMTGALAADLVRLAVTILFFPFRVVGWAFRMMNNGRS